MTRPRVADDFAAIRARMEQLQRERWEPEQRATRDWKEDLDCVDPKLVEEVKRIIRAGSGITLLKRGVD